MWTDGTDRQEEPQSAARRWPRIARIVGRNTLWGGQLFNEKVVNFSARINTIRVEHEYDRGGALQYLAAWDCHRAKLFGRCEPHTGIAPFDRLVAQVMTTPPYPKARRVFWIVDNGSSHRGEAAIRRLEGRFRNLRLIHLPLHASWLNQVEIYFAIVQRKVLTPNDFTNPGEIEARVLAFQAGYEQVARPFEWKFTRTDLARLMKKLAAQEAQRSAA